MRFLKFLLGDYSAESRDRREVNVVKQLGADVLVFDKAETSIERVIDGAKVIGAPTVSSYNSRFLNHAASAMNRIHILRQIDCDVMSCHDLKALLIGWLSKRFKHSKPVFVYDAHELETARNTIRKRSKTTTLFVKKLEGFLMKRCSFSIVVNDSIANEMATMHNLDSSPIVVRSCPLFWKYDEDSVAEKRNFFCSKLNLDFNESFIVLYHGAVVSGRGIEQCIQAVSFLEDIGLVIMGNAERGYLDSLYKLASEKRVSDRVLFLEAVSRNDLESFVAAADIGCAT